MVLLIYDLFKKSFAEWKIFVRHCESKSVCRTGFVLCCAAFTYGDCIFYVSTNVNRVVRKSMENAWKMKQDRHYEGDTEFILRYICRR